MADEAKPEGSNGAGTTGGQSMTLEQILAANPELKKRVDAGDAALAKLTEAEQAAARKAGDYEGLLKAEKDAHGKTAEEKAKLDAKVKSYERREKISQFVDGQKELPVPAKAAYDMMVLLDDGKSSPEDLLKSAVAKIQGWGVAPKATDAMESGGSGTGAEGATGNEAELQKLIALGVTAMKSGRPGDRMAYNNLRMKLQESGVKIGPDVARKIAAGVGT